ncbi:MAG: glycosyltransferase family 61 protein [Candidatus Dependentiae bacterium]|nr:glycosyltransferase family 61 protein [Candidatus Dependentiae bacterium]
MNVWRFCLLVAFFVQLKLEAQELQIVSMYDLMRADKSIKFLSCDEKEAFAFKEFPLKANPPLFQPSQGMLQGTFVLTIPQGQVYFQPKDIAGIILASGSIVEEMLWPSKEAFFGRHKKFQLLDLPEDGFKVEGRMAVITQEVAGCYGHWLIEVLGRLALLERYGVQYDKLYVPQNYPFQKESLALWGIDQEKIIDSFQVPLVKAQELVVPSLVCRKSPALPRKPLCCMYSVKWIVEYVRNKFLPILSREQMDKQFSKKIFISRNDAGSRRVINEDDLFALFEPLGFERYFLTELSFIEQVGLFANAEIIIGPSGSGLTNLIFCNPGTCIVELFQARGDCTFFYLSQLIGLKHICLQSMTFSQGGGFFDTTISLDIIQDFIKNEMKL